MILTILIIAIIALVVRIFRHKSPIIIKKKITAINKL
jgi:hypothetical protein